MATSAQPHMPLWYRLFFLYIEPVSALAGAYYAFFEQQQYLELTHPPSAPKFYIPMGTSIALTQLANLYLLFALSEALVLRSTTDLKVWRAILVAMLIADFGHLYSVQPLGWEVYYDVLNYNAIDWGNVVFVYIGAATRAAFLSGIGLHGASTAKRSARPVSTPRSTRIKRN